MSDSNMAWDKLDGKYLKISIRFFQGRFNVYGTDEENNEVFLIYSESLLN